uniref:HECT-type E3 ubiquitin transferase n=1 Tax=Panagrolaimus sp. PS1159 TaxID=55785 RepID=A0AC35G8I0_9BILA
MDERQKFLEKAAQERAEREHLKLYAAIALDIQAIIRANIARKKFHQKLRSEFDLCFGTEYDVNHTTPTNLDMLKYGFLLPFLSKEPGYITRISIFCRHISSSMDSPSKNHTFAALFLSPQYFKRASRLITKFFDLIPSVLAEIDFDQIIHAKAATSIVTFLVVLTSPSNWALLKANPSLLPVVTNFCNKFSSSFLTPELMKCFHTFLLKAMKRGKSSSDIINAIVTIIFRVVQQNNTLENEKTELLVKYVYTCPGIVLALNPNAYSLLKTIKTLEALITYFNSNPKLVDSLNVVETLNVLANFINISFRENDVLIENLLEWTHIINNFFARIQSSNPKHSKKQHWHPILGWISEGINLNNQDANVIVRQQLQYFWSKKMVKCLFGKVLGSIEGNQSAAVEQLEVEKLSKDLIQRLMKHLTVKEQPRYDSHLGPVSLTAVVCQMYRNALLTFTTIHVDIISGLCQDDSVLTQLWTYISNSKHGISHSLLNLFNADPTASVPHFAPIALFAEIALSLISILDEKELYEEGTPFNMKQIIDISQFVNHFCFKAIWDKAVDFKNEKSNNLFQSLYHLTILLHNKHVRRAFCDNPNFWHARDVRSSIIVGEFEKRTERGLLLMEKMPHLIPLKERLVLFRKLVSADKSSLEKLITVATISRNSIIEDGFRMFSTLSPTELKAGLRVKFVNQQGLEEAGIDQDGVFKEFLELTVKGIFDPELNLFKLTANGQLYPSNTSNIHSNHLEYFSYIGRMLGKSVYDGFLVDVQLAPVLLAKILGKELCAFDELALVDQDLYKSLTYVKHYKDSDDVADLELTFSVDEEFLGQINTVDLVPSGRSIKVTNENKIVYIHTMAQHRVVKQTKKQRDHFIAGFRSIISPTWLSLFSTHELQMLISGTTYDIDVGDLRKNTAYYGGFHSKHRVIKWLWEIIEHDFTPDERKLFLKFVTSCSRGPLLGFSTLEPPFSIRCIEVGDDQDQGDTLGSVVRGFFAIKRNRNPARLPTSSTCFNLLKLPNYSKKSLLLEKLRYAIHSNAGFELS